APRISQLREEGSFVIKEKKSDISHLMTETLANIYVEQKLYARAIHAFHILAEKHPQKAEYFRAKVKEVRDLRNNFHELNQNENGQHYISDRTYTVRSPCRLSKWTCRNWRRYRNGTCARASFWFYAT